jgi:hypothetical protein
MFHAKGENVVVAAVAKPMFSRSQRRAVTEAIFSGEKQRFNTVAIFYGDRHGHLPKCS